MLRTKDILATQPARDALNGEATSSDRMVPAAHDRGEPVRVADDRSAYAAAMRLAMRKRAANEALRLKANRLPIPVHNA